ncbi:HEAT repeat-containing protein 6 isoform X2 [Parasteatoda tepidariorum]|uniref:HEAT repeat-containing protein 6 isoform X2 n=1 Tax=Parasteatoda tepidariorum TaxID=114398 RepID=UPI00077FBE80|nr:HEAT repeat-containing protein 6 isoform X2 [Parasteatoda tepidariorum]
MSVGEYLSIIKESVSLEETDLNNIFDRINLLSTANVAKESEAVGELLLNLAKLVPTNNDHILSKFCCLLCYFLENSTEVLLQSTSSEHLFEFFISKLSSCGIWVLSDVLVAFSCLLSKMPLLELDHVDILLKDDSILFMSSVEDKSIQYNALQCLFALLKNHSETVHLSKKMNVCFQKCLSLLKESVSENSKINAKILICSLKCLQLIFSYEIAVIKKIGEILGILKSLSFYGFPGPLLSFDLMPTLSLPLEESLSESDTPHSMFRKQKKTRRRIKKNHHRSSQSNKNEHEDHSENSGTDNNLSTFSNSFRDIKIKSSSSDSEFSDVDSQLSGMRALSASVRQNAYQALQIFVKCIDKKIMFSYWTAFLPDHPAVSVSLFYTVLKDLAPHVRLNALILLSEIIRGSKQYLILADGRSTRHSAFTSLSSILASMITETHRCLLLALISEKSSLLLLQILKCYAVLAENVPYNKLRNEILFKYLMQIKGFLFHKDVQVQVAALAVFISILNSDQTPEEFESLMLSSDFDRENDTPWIVDVCKQIIYHDEHMPLRIQSLQVLCSMTKKYFPKSRSFLPFIKDVIFFCLNDSQPSLQYYGIKLVDVIGRCTNDVSNLEESISLLSSEIFLNAVTKPLITCLTNEEQKHLQASVCDCLSTLPAKDFALLDSRLQILYVSILLGLTSDSNANTRGSAIRCLGIFCLFPSLIEDASFYDDLSRILVKTVNDTNVNVRFKASWALGNLSDGLLLKRRDFANEMSAELFYSICMGCIEYSKDCDRVKANAVRALGNFLLFIPRQYLSSLQILELIGKACETLLCALSANFMKVCWNACYALKSMMRNDSLLELSALIKMLCHSFCHLVSLVTLQDLSAVKEDTLLAKEMLLTSMWKFGTHLSEEKSAILSTALKNIEVLGCEVSHNVILMTLQDVLNQATFASRSLH